MFLINAIYFKANWKYEFDESKTTGISFRLADGSSKAVQAMNQKTDFGYFENDILQILEMPYGGEKFTMMVLLPKNNYSTGDIVAELTDENWNLWIQSLYETEINVTLPKFKFEFEKELNEMLIAMGMGVAFDADNADFSGINNQAQIFISKVKHKTFVDVNEEGTEAAAVTVVEMELTSTGNYFYADKPFLFAIREKSTNSILFIGKVADPVYD